MTKRIKVIDYTISPRAVNSEHGKSIMKVISESIQKKEKVTLDFKDIDLTITAFLNPCIGDLYGKFNISDIQNYLDIQNLNSDEMPLLEEVVLNAKKTFHKN